MLIQEFIQRKIYDFKVNKIMFDVDLSEMYGVETRTLKQAARRNMNRFPGDFLIIPYALVFIYRVRVHFPQH